MGENVTFHLSVSALKAEIYKKNKIIENGKMINLPMKLKQKNSFLWQPNAKHRGPGLWVRAIKEPTFHQKMWGLWVTAAETISKNMGSLGDSSAENKGSLEPYIRVTSIMGVPPGFKAFKLWLGQFVLADTAFFQNIVFSRFRYVLLCKFQFVYRSGNGNIHDYITRRNKTERKP